jgi:hypothetical protein
MASVAAAVLAATATRSATAVLKGLSTVLKLLPLQYQQLQQQQQQQQQRMR